MLPEARFPDSVRARLLEDQLWCSGPVAFLRRAAGRRVPQQGFAHVRRKAELIDRTPFKERKGTCGPSVDTTRRQGALPSP